MAKGSARVPRACERVLAIANFVWIGYLCQAAKTKERLFRRDAETSTRDACATLLPCGLARSWLHARRLKPKNCFARFHQIEPVARDRFQIRRIGLE